MPVSKCVTSSGWQTLSSENGPSLQQSRRLVKRVVAIQSDGVARQTRDPGNYGPAADSIQSPRWPEMADGTCPCIIPAIASPTGSDASLRVPLGGLLPSTFVRWARGCGKLPGSECTGMRDCLLGDRPLAGPSDPGAHRNLLHGVLLPAASAPPLGCPRASE